MTNSTEKNDSVQNDAGYARRQEQNKETCDSYVANGLKQNRSIQFLIQQLDKMGCTPPEGFIRCTDCGYLQALGAFHLLSETRAATEIATTELGASTSATTSATTSMMIPAACSSYFADTLKRMGQVAKSNESAQDRLMEQMNAGVQTSTPATNKTPEIFLCQQHLSSEGQAHRVIMHELIHAIDTCRTKMDPQKNCIHLACTEIRAENLSGECNFWNELMRLGPHSLKKHGQDCVKRRAMLSVGSHPRCRDRSEEFVDAAMRRCYSDIFPFERHPNEQPP